MEDADMRNQVLSELIDKMHGRMADKMYPDAPAPTDAPKTDEAMPEAHIDAVAIMPEAKSDDSDDMSDSDIDEILKSC